MIWKYILVFIGAFLVDVVPFPFPPACTVMLLLLYLFHLNTWTVIIVGVAGSILGRYVLTLYIPKLSARVFNPGKNEDVQFLGKKMKEKGWKSQLVVLAYSLLPLPTTPLFVAAGMAKLKPVFILPAFFIGKFTSDTVVLLTAKYVADNGNSILQNLLSWKAITGLALGLGLLFALFFIDWRMLIQKNKLRLKFKIWR